MVRWHALAAALNKQVHMSLCINCRKQIDKRSWSDSTWEQTRAVDQSGLYSQLFLLLFCTIVAVLCSLLMKA
jgi:hypothetical protein